MTPSPGLVRAKDRDCQHPHEQEDAPEADEPAPPSGGIKAGARRSKYFGPVATGRDILARLVAHLDHHRSAVHGDQILHIARGRAEAQFCHPGTPVGEDLPPHGSTSSRGRGCALLVATGLSADAVT